MGSFYVYCIWFFGIKFTWLQKLYMFETLLENKPFVTNIYSEVIGAEKTLFNFKMVDECDLPKKSAIMRVKKRKEPKPVEGEV